MPNDLQATKNQFYRDLARHTTRGLTKHLEAELTTELTKEQATKKLVCVRTALDPHQSRPFIKDVEHQDMPEETEIRLTFEQLYKAKDHLIIGPYVWSVLSSDQPNTFEAREYSINRICQELPEDGPI